MGSFKKNTDLIVPIYLNRQIVFDLVAMRKGGITFVESVNAIQSKNVSAEAGASVQITSDTLLANLFKIGVKGQGKMKGESGSANSETSEKIHTPASLCYQLRGELVDDGQLRALNMDCQVGDFVEFETKLQQNPLTSALEEVVAFLDFFDLFSEDSAQRKKAPNQSGEKARMKKIQERVTGLLSMLDGSKSKDILAVSGCGLNSILSIDPDNLVSLNIADIADGRFSVFGKVIRKLEGDNDAVDLLRKTGLRGSPDRVEKLVEAINKLGESVFSWQRIIHKIKGPGFHIMPIAIYS